MESERKKGQNGKGDKSRVSDFEAYRNSPLWKDRTVLKRKKSNRAAAAKQPARSRILYAMAGLTPEESAGLEERLREMS